MVVAPRSLFKCLKTLIRTFIKRSCYFLAVYVVSASLHVHAQLVSPVEQNNFIARIELHTADELKKVLRRSGELFDADSGSPATPVVFVLHGPEASVFFRERYRHNQELVDLAAKLTALNVVDIKVCRTWMGSQGLDSSQLLPFVGTVPYGPAAERQLIEQKAYRYF